MAQTKSYVAQQLEYELKIKELQKHNIELQTSKLKLITLNEKYELQKVYHKKETEELTQCFHAELENANERSQTKIDKLELEIEERQRIVLELKTSTLKLEKLHILANQEIESQKRNKAKETENLRKYFNGELRNTNERSQIKINELKLEIEGQQRLVFELETSNLKLEQSNSLANQENKSQKVKQESENMRKKAEGELDQIQIQEKDRVIETLVKREKELVAIIAIKDAENQLQADEIRRLKTTLYKNASDRRSLTTMTKETDLNWLSYI